MNTMMQKIILLTDYLNRFGSKHNDMPYRSGFDKTLMKKYFNDYGYEPVFKSFASIDFSQENYRDELILYTSSEDVGYHYKSFIEDIVLGLELQGAKVIPRFKYLRANNNKVFMEILRDQIIGSSGLKAKYYGTFEELENDIDNIHCPAVIKKAQGATGAGVFLAQSKKELLTIAKKITRTRNLHYELWDYGRSIKHKGYIRESRYREKFIVQDFIPNLENDWKVLIYDDKYYALYRANRKNDFRASGSGFFKFEKYPPLKILDFSEKIIRSFDLPNISIDIGINDTSLFLLEFQAIYFGTYTLEASEFYFIKNGNNWERKDEKSIIEKEYVNSICKFISRNLETGIV